MNKNIDLAFTIDKFYIQHVGVLLCSLFENNPDLRFNIHLIVDFLADRELQRLKRLVASYGQNLYTILVQKEKVSAFKLSDHATSAVYYRLLLPDILDENICKILYLDADMIIKNNILQLWETELEKYPLAAVQEPMFDRHKALGMCEGTPYFNSGVMLINLPVWRKMQVSKLAMDFIRQYPERVAYWDQDGLNAVLNGDWLELAPKWNLQTKMLDIKIPVEPNEDERLKEALKKPAIIHYSSKFKPWHYWCEHPLKEEYFIYLKKTPWKDFTPKPETRVHSIKQQVKKLINKMTGRELFQVYA